MNKNRNRFILLSLCLLVGVGFALTRRNSVATAQSKAPVPPAKVTAVLGAAPLRALQAAPQVTIYSISPYAVAASPAVAKNEKLGRWVVLGKTQVSGAQKNALLQAFYNGINQPPSWMAKCFWPRHAIRVNNNGKSYDFVICFECYQFSSSASATSGNQPISPEAQPTFDAILKNASVPLAG
jgi:hypothetical protein